MLKNKYDTLIVLIVEKFSGYNVTATFVLFYVHGRNFSWWIILFIIISVLAVAGLLAVLMVHFFFFDNKISAASSTARKIRNINERDQNGTRLHVEQLLILLLHVCCRE